MKPRVEEELGVAPEFGGISYGADMRHFCARQIPCVLAGPPGTELPHAPDERVVFGDQPARQSQTILWRIFRQRMQNSRHTRFDGGVFLPVTLAGYLLLATMIEAPVARIVWLSLASLAFYGYWNVAFLPVICVSIVANFLFALAITAFPTRARALLVAAVAANLLALGFYKYVNFGIEIFNAVAPHPLQAVAITEPKVLFQVHVPALVVGTAQSVVAGVAICRVLHAVDRD